MPHSRRRKFSVHNDIARRNAAKGATSVITSNTTSISGSSIESKNNKNKTYANSLVTVQLMEMVEEHDENSPVSLAIKTADENDVDNSNNIHVHSADKNIFESSESPSQPPPQAFKRDTRSMDRCRREKAHQRRVRVRSPKNRLLILDPKPNKDLETSGSDADVSIAENSGKETVGTNTIDWKQVSVYNTNARVLDLDVDLDVSDSLEDMCRICHGGDSLSAELGTLISACNCRGTVGRVHVRCLERWLTESGKSRCELCGTRYATRRVHRYGVFKALVMWFLSQNAKQLMVDSLGIMLMSPLAVLAAWLSGRTLAGLMTQERQFTPWPLASTFVLACMTLVCYYCWIVSAATRHALGWWVWYRAQYEVRLEIQDEE